MEIFTQAAFVFAAYVLGFIVGRLSKKEIER
jgi:hypothetical protein